MLTKVLLLVFVIAAGMCFCSCKVPREAVAKPLVAPPPVEFVGFTHRNDGNCQYAADIGNFLTQHGSEINPPNTTPDIVITSEQPWFDDPCSYKTRVTVKFKGSIILSREIDVNTSGLKSDDEQNLFNQIKK